MLPRLDHIGIQPELILNKAATSRTFPKFESYCGKRLEVAKGRLLRLPFVMAWPLSRPSTSCCCFEHRRGLSLQGKKGVDGRDKSPAMTKGEGSVGTNHTAELGNQSSSVRRGVKNGSPIAFTVPIVTFYGIGRLGQLVLRYAYSRP
jgi:hypothetical protein